MNMDKPKNPYREGTVIWRLFEEDWSGMTAAEIGGKLFMSRDSVHTCLNKIKRQTGYVVLHTTERDRKARKGNKG